MVLANFLLSPEAQAQAEALAAIHSVAGLQAFLRDKGAKGAAEGTYAVPEEQAVRWPLVRHHPRTGRRALYFGSKVTVGIDGWEPGRARAYLRDLEHLATAPALSETSGYFFERCNPILAGGYTEDREMAKRLWDVSAELAAGYI